MCWLCGPCRWTAPPRGGRPCGGRAASPGGLAQRLDGAEVIGRQGANPSFFRWCAGRTLRGGSEVHSVGCAKPPYGEQAQPTLNNVVQKPLGRLAQRPLSPHKPPKGGLISATLLVAWRLFWRPPMAETDSPLTPIYNTQVKGITEQPAGMPAALDLGVAGAVRPWPRSIPQSVSLLFPRWCCASACGPFSPVLAHGGLYSPGLSKPFSGGARPPEKALFVSSRPGSTRVLRGLPL